MSGPRFHVQYPLGQGSHVCVLSWFLPYGILIFSQCLQNTDLHSYYIGLNS